MNIFDTTLLERFLQIVDQAAEQCVTNNSEEEGGIILYKAEDFKFIKIENKHKGTSISHTLYEVNPEEFGTVVAQYVCDGWQLFSSFHTHPAFPPTPSSTDLNYLFPGYKYNVIYSQLNKTYNLNVWLAGTPVSFITRQKR